MTMSNVKFTTYQSKVRQFFTHLTAGNVEESLQIVGDQAIWFDWYEEVDLNSLESSLLKQIVYHSWLKWLGWFFFQIRPPIV